MVASLSPVSYILKTSVTRSSSLADNFGAWGGTFSFPSLAFDDGPAEVDVAVVEVAGPVEAAMFGIPAEVATDPGGAEAVVDPAMAVVAVLTDIFLAESANCVCSIWISLVSLQMKYRKKWSAHDKQQPTIE